MTKTQRSLILVAALVASTHFCFARPMFRTLYSFTGNPDGASPASLIAGANGVLYGITGGGGTCAQLPAGCGTVFQLTPPTSPGGEWTETLLIDFSSGTNGYPIAGGSLVRNKEGVLYGTTIEGGIPSAICGPGGCGIVFQLTPPSLAGGAWTEATLHIFTGYPGDGDTPFGPPVLGADGVLYGTTYGGGSIGAEGTFYKLAPRFQVAPGARPS